MTLRDSINNLIRSDRPESPTDLIFIFGSLILCDLQIYATLAHTTVPHFGEMLTALCSFKAVKVGSNYVKKGKAAPAPAQEVTDAPKP